MTFRDWIFSKLPAWYKESDTYVDANGEGLLERYCRIYGLELDEEYVDQLEDYTRILDPLITDSKFLNLIAYQLGSPTDIFSDESLYRRFLSIIIQIYKVKGTSIAYDLIFGLLGWNVQLIIIYPQDIVYDDDHKYDEEEPVLYDDVCGTCVEYYLLITPIGTDCQNPGAWINPDISDIYNELKKAICFIEPINAKLLGIVPTLPICEEAGLSPSESIVIEISETINYDEDHLYDDSEVYDSTLLSTTTINWP
jgi:hypothetical protein